MIDREKVIKGLEWCMVGDGHSPKCELCPYATVGDDTCQTMDDLFADALALLKAQERDIADMRNDLQDTLAENLRLSDLLKAQEPRVERQGRWERVGSDGIVCCSVCGVPMGKTRVCFPDGDSGYYYIATKYCPHCGARNEKGDCDG